MSRYGTVIKMLKDLGPGERLTSWEIAEKTGFSDISVRDQLKKFEKTGRLDSKMSKGRGRQKAYRIKG